MSISENLSQIEAGIAAACQKSGRSRETVQLVAVSKTKPNEAIAEAIEAGQTHFGENKVQELVAKNPVFPNHINWHLIGHLQTNKIRKALPFCSLLHTLDSVDLADKADRISAELGIRTEALIQVNIANDEAKFGFSAEETECALDHLLSRENLKIRGLMTIPAFDPDPEITRVHFANLRSLRDRLEHISGHSLSELSMGMSHDYHVAIEEGATLVRVGSSIFGSRG